MKKVLILSISSLLGFSLIACDSNSAKSTANSSNDSIGGTQYSAPADFVALKQMANDAVKNEGNSFGIDENTADFTKIPALYEVESVDFILRQASFTEKPSKYLASECGKQVGYDFLNAQITEPSDKNSSDCFAMQAGDDDLVASELKEVETNNEDYDVSELSFAVDNNSNILIRARVQFETEGEYASSNITKENNLSYIFLEYPLLSFSNGNLSLGENHILKVWLKEDMEQNKSAKPTSKAITLKADNLPKISFSTERDGDKILTLQQDLELDGKFITLRIAGEFEGIARSELENKLDGAPTKYFRTHRNRVTRN